MSSDALKDRQKALEDSFFAKENEAALKRLQSRKVLKSPVSGEPMEQVSLMGVNIDRCVQSGGVWLDAGELEQIIANAQQTDKDKGNHWISSFIGGLFKAR